MNDKKTQGQSRVIGMDLHPSCFSASALLNTNNAATAIVQWTHDKVKYNTLQKWAMKHLLSTDIVVIEAGSNSFNCAGKLKELDICCIVLESYSASKIGKAYLKNDKIDSIKLARAYISGLAREVWQPDKKTMQRREILSLYTFAKKNSVKSQNRLTSWCTQHGIQRPKSMTWKKKNARDWVLKQLNWVPIQKILINNMFDSLVFYQNQRKELEKYMANDVMSDKQLIKLLQISGIRHITAFAIGAVVGDISRFRNPKKLVAYVGLCPKVDESGINKKQRHLCKTGRKDLRSILVQGAHAVIKQDPAFNRFARWGQHIQFKKNKNIAVIGIARKMIVAVWYLLRGFTPEVKELTDHIRIKVSKIGSVIGKQSIKEQGYSTIKAYMEEKSKYIIGTT